MAHILTRGGAAVEEDRFASLDAIWAQIEAAKERADARHAARLSRLSEEERGAEDREYAEDLSPEDVEESLQATCDMMDTARFCGVEWCDLEDGPFSEAQRDMADEGWC